MDATTPAAAETPATPVEAAPAIPQSKTPSQTSVIQKSQLQQVGSVRDGLPSDETLNENTLEGEPPNPADVGQYTEQLSDVSDGEDEQAQRTASRNALSTWYRRIQPLIRNKRVRVFAIISSILTILNLILFIGCMVILGFLIFEFVGINMVVVICGSILLCNISLSTYMKMIMLWIFYVEGVRASEQPTTQCSGDSNWDKFNKKFWIPFFSCVGGCTVTISAVVIAIISVRYKRERRNGAPAVDDAETAIAQTNVNGHNLNNVGAIGFGAPISPHRTSPALDRAFWTSN